MRNDATPSKIESLISALLFVIGMALILVGLSSCGGSQSGASTVETATFYGDSLTAWGSYPDAIGEKLGLKVINYARPSSMVADELQLNLSRSAEKTKVCVIMFGFNDAHHAKNALEYKTELQMLIKSCSKNSEKVYVATQPMAKVIGGGHDYTIAQATRDAVWELKLWNVKLVDINVQFDYDVATELDIDQVHFNEAGNAHLARIWLKNL